MNRVKSAFASDRERLDAGHLAEKILDSILFAVLSIALKSERDISDASKTPGNRDLKGKDCSSFGSTRSSECVFFPVYVGA